MKKTYNSPATNVIRIEKILLQTTSLNVDSTKEVKSVDRLLGRQGFFENDSDED
ncbi:MAG: hypothetical protein IJ144_02520 [Prevotella sp.]|nr:hypothetical protein [Prevotella sp.]MBQ9186684.1 hypothetical protein [Prevotella sp.]